MAYSLTILNLERAVCEIRRIVQNLWQSTHIVHTTAGQIHEDRTHVQKVHNLICNNLVGMVALSPQVAISTLDPKKQGSYSQKS